VLYSILKDQAKAKRNETEISSVTIKRKKEIVIALDSKIRGTELQRRLLEISYNEKREFRNVYHYRGVGRLSSIPEITSF
jgi:hypothetical protein